jgi:hypothetical protein
MVGLVSTGNLPGERRLDHSEVVQRQAVLVLRGPPVQHPDGRDQTAAKLHGRPGRDHNPGPDRQPQPPALLVEDGEDKPTTALAFNVSRIGDHQCRSLCAPPATTASISSRSG